MRFELYVAERLMVVDHCGLCMLAHLHICFMASVETEGVISRTRDPVQSAFVIQYAVTDVARFTYVKQVGCCVCGRRRGNVYAVYSGVVGYVSLVNRPVTVEVQMTVHVTLRGG